MMTLENLMENLKEVDQIEDDQEFSEVEYDVIFDYCQGKDFCLSDDELSVIRNRGLGDSFEYWKSLYTDCELVG